MANVERTKNEEENKSISADFLEVLRRFPGEMSCEVGLKQDVDFKFVRAGLSRGIRSGEIDIYWNENSDLRGPGDATGFINGDNVVVLCGEDYSDYLKTVVWKEGKNITKDPILQLAVNTYSLYVQLDNLFDEEKSTFFSLKGELEDES